jgi:hypothetical protein
MPDVIWRPSPKQEAFLAAPEDEVLFGGAAGGGKSEALIVDALGLQHDALGWDRYRALLIRQTTPQLRELIDRTRAMYPLVYPGAEYSEQAKEWRFPSGAKVIFGYAEREADAHQYQGQEYQWIGIDELGHFRSPYVWDYLSSRLRSINPAIPCYMRATCNPGPKWIRERWGFSAAGEASRRNIVVDGRTFTRRFIPSKIDDNAHLANTGYKQRLMQLPPQERAALLEGRWDVVDVPGAIFGDQLKDAREHERIRSVPVQPEAPLNTVWDLGIGDATAIWLWQRIGSEVHCVGYVEDSGEGLPYYVGRIKEFATQHGATFGEHYAPPDIAVREFSSGMSRVETARQHGIAFHVLPPSGLEDGIHAARMLFPRVYFDEKACAAGIDALTHYRRDYNGRLGEFKPTPVHDWASHGADAFRYLAIASGQESGGWKPLSKPHLAIV